jgi:NAD(P)-dependent dehydrogenase (short-subunit alcohol dehydrogenase family)
VRTLSLEIAPLRANVIRPGRTDTPWFRSFIGAPPGAAGDTHLSAAGADVPIGRVATADEAAAAVLFAMSNPALTGAVIAIDGGGSVG